MSSDSMFDIVYNELICSLNKTTLEVHSTICLSDGSRQLCIKKNCKTCGYITIHSGNYGSPYDDDIKEEGSITVHVIKHDSAFARKSYIYPLYALHAVGDECDFNSKMIELSPKALSQYCSIVIDVVEGNRTLSW